jgi:hypothetical protein
MFKHIVRNSTLVLTFAALLAPTMRAQTTSTPPTSPAPAVTGGDPEPTSPDVVQTVLVFLHLG